MIQIAEARGPIIAPSWRDVQQYGRLPRGDRSRRREMPEPFIRAAWSQVGTPNSASGTTSVSVTNPTGLADNDALVAFIFTGPDTVTPTITGFTQRVSFNLAADNVRFTVLTKIASGEGASQTIGSIGSSTGTFAGLQAWRGGDTSNIYDTGGAGTTGTSTTSATAGAITVATSTALLLYMAVWGSTGAGTAPGSMTENLDVSDGSSLRLYSAYQVLSSSGSTGSKTATISGGATDYLAVLIALNLAPAGGWGLLFGQSRNRLVM